MNRLCVSSRHSRCQGFTLVEIAVVLVIVAIMIAMAAFFTRGLVGAQKRSTTASRIATVDAALVQFAMANKRLPCPANGTLDSSDANAGLERVPGGPCTNSQKDGVVPWVTLGLAEPDASDGWDRRLTYRVEPTLVSANALDMTMCDAAGTGTAAAATCAPGCTAATASSCTQPAQYLVAKGIRISNLAGTAVMAPPGAVPNTSMGAAYVVISHGETGGGGYLGSGQLSTSTTTDGAEEIQNYASNTYSAASIFYDDNPRETPTHFDDVVSRPSILSVAQKAGLGPRAH